MTIVKKYGPPTLPLPPAEYAQTYGNELIKVLRLFFNDNDATVNAILALLNNGGYFPSLTAGTVTANQFTGGNFSGLNANLAAVVAQVLNGNVQGGNGVFNNLTAAQSNASLFTGSGREISFPHIAAYDTTSQYTTTNTATVVNWNALESGLGWTLNSPGSATAAYDGVYKITYSLQFANTDNSQHTATCWLQVNGSDVANSTTSFSVPARKNPSTPGYLCAYSEVVFSLEAGDEIELYWATDQARVLSPSADGVYMIYEAAQASPYVRPAIPSAIGSIVYVSAPPDPKTQITPIGVLGTGQIGTATISVQNNT